MPHREAHVVWENCPRKEGACVAVSGFTCPASRRIILPQMMVIHHASMAFSGGPHAVGIEE